MSRAVIQNGTHLWSDHFTPTPSSALSFNMEFARAIFNLGNRGSLTDNPHSTKEADVHATNLDDIFIDDLTEFSNEEIGAPISNTDLHFPGFQSCESSSATLISDNTFSFPPANGVEGTNPLGDPHNRNGQKDTIAQLYSGITPELEWLSAFDEDSYSFHGVSNNSFLSVNDQVLLSSPGLYESNRFDKISSNLYPSDGFGSPACEEQSEFSADAKGFPLEVSVPARARSKRSRSAVRVWSSGVLCKTNSPQGPTSDDQFSDPSVPAGLDFYQDRGAGEAVIDVAEFRSPLKQSLECSSDSKNEWKMLGKSKKGQDSGQARRCAHCLSQKTPQWRQGPTGPKTLCNACGVRFKSGRLFPEYRPAKSPTFLTQIHSNSHKKVLEMRRQRLTAQTSQQTQEQEQRKVRLKVPEESIQIPLQGEVNQIRRTQEQGGFQYEH